MAFLWRGYVRVLGKYPLPTMCSTTGTLMAAGDAISQIAIEKTSIKDINGIRTGRFFVLGFCALGPMMRYWYLALDKMYAGTRYAPFKMVLTDQMIGAPIVITTFLAGLGILKGEDSKQIVQKLKMDFVPLLINNYKIWPAAQIINFYFMPLQHRVLFVNFVALGWNTFLAWFSERNEQR